MTKRWTFGWRAGWLLIVTVMLAAKLPAAAPMGLETLDLTVDGLPRQALVYAPKPKPGQTLPLVFAFHGHGATAIDALHEFGIYRRWPEAISVYPQGLPIQSITDAAGTKAGWQHTVGEAADRDLHYFDALLAKLRSTYPVDPQRIYATGHSNGGGFAYLLWLARGEVFAAVAPCSAAPKFTADLKPKPAFIGAGTHDPIVPFAHQEEEAATLRKVNDCTGTGEPWEGSQAVVYAPKSATPLVTYFYDGGHPMTQEEPGLIVKFFQQHPSPDGSPSAKP